MRCRTAACTVTGAAPRSADSSRGPLRRTQTCRCDQLEHDTSRQANMRALRQTGPRGARAPSVRPTARCTSVRCEGWMCQHARDQRPFEFGWPIANPFRIEMPPPVPETQPGDVSMLDGSQFNVHQFLANLYFARVDRELPAEGASKSIASAKVDDRSGPSDDDSMIFRIFRRGSIQLAGRMLDRNVLPVPHAAW